MYELRMHEGLAVHDMAVCFPLLPLTRNTHGTTVFLLGDGEPDKDFPALDRTKIIKQFNLNEYCLCETDEDFMGGEKMDSPNKSSRLDSDASMGNVKQRKNYWMIQQDFSSLLFF